METRYLIAPYLDTGFLNKTLFFGFGSKRKVIEDFDLQKGTLEAAIIMQTPRSLSRLHDHLHSKGFEENIIDRATEILKDGFLFPEGTFDLSDPSIGNLLYYCFSGADPEKVKREISEKSVVIFGCYGIGTMVAYALASFGIRKLVLIDNTTVDNSFKYRQMIISPDDVGKSSSICLKAHLERCFDGMCIEVKHSSSLSDSLDRVGSADFLVHTSLGANSLSMINRFCVARKIPFMDAGNIEDISVWGPLYIPGKTGCTECWSNRSQGASEQNEIRDLCRSVSKNYHAPNNVGINMLTASLATLDIMKFLLGFGEVRSLNNRIGLWTHNGVFETKASKRNPECTVCSCIKQEAAAC
jgi:molybdopterin/thiamine biosynthesis adenylyltransferase